MARIAGKTISRIQIMEKVGDISQIASARQIRLVGGKADGLHAIEFKTGSGLNFLVLPGRSMDIPWAEYKGISLGFISKTGLVHSSYYEPEDDGFHRSFYAGLLTTCGLRNIGRTCIDESEHLGLHGRISNIPAEDVCVTQDWIEDDFVMRSSGKVRESKLYGENLLLSRSITAVMGEKSFILRDTIENCGFVKEPLTLLYHCNLGFPLLDVNSYLVAPVDKTIPRDSSAAQSLNEYDRFIDPLETYPETVFYHTLKSNESNMTYAAIYNPDLGDKGLGLAIIYDKTNLPNLIEWKNMSKGDYVVAIEPANSYPEGRDQIKKRGDLRYLEPGEVIHIEIQFKVIDGLDDLAKLKSIV